MPPDLAGFVADQIRSGVYSSEAELVYEALRLLRAQSADSTMDPEIRDQLDQGYAQIAGGESIEVDEASLPEFFASLRNEAAGELLGKSTTPQ
jgi:Arc/MetJ-type ribon-helix-helix transcriptional regulator